MTSTVVFELEDFSRSSRSCKFISSTDFENGTNNGYLDTSRNVICRTVPLLVTLSDLKIISAIENFSRFHTFWK